MSSSPSLSSSTSKPLVSYSFQDANPMPLMENLFSVAKGSDAAVQEEVIKTSQVLSAFIEQTNEQLRTMSQRNAELEAKFLASEMQRETTEKMHQAQMQSLQQLTETVQQMATQMNGRMDTLDNRLLTTNQRIDQLRSEATPSIQDHGARAAAAHQQAMAQAAVQQMLNKFSF